MIKNFELAKRVSWRMSSREERLDERTPSKLSYGHFLLCREDGGVDPFDGHRCQSTLVDGLEGVLCGKGISSEDRAESSARDARAKGRTRF